MDGWTNGWTASLDKWIDRFLQFLRQNYHIILLGCWSGGEHREFRSRTRFLFWEAEKNRNDLSGEWWTTTCPRYFEYYVWDPGRWSEYKGWN